MKVVIELPDNWINEDMTGNLDFMFRTVKQEVAKQVKDRVVEEVLKNTPLPEITITGAEIKDRMITILAERALQKNNE